MAISIGKMIERLQQMAKDSSPDLEVWMEDLRTSHPVKEIVYHIADRYSLAGYPSPPEGKTIAMIIWR